MSLMGMVPFGNLLGGALASRIGAPETVAAGGALCVAAALLFALRLPSLSRAAAPIRVAPTALPGDPVEALPPQEG